MPPSPAKPAVDASGAGIRALCILIASATEFNPNYNAAADQLGLAQGKNVPRRIDTIIKPYGYVLRSKKFVKLNKDGTTPNVPMTPKAKGLKTPATSDAEEQKPAAKSPAKKNGATKQRKSPTKKAATPKAKKRKIEEVKAEALKTEEVEEDEDDEAMKMIKEKMGDGTDDEEGEEVKDDEED